MDSNVARPGLFVRRTLYWLTCFGSRRKTFFAGEMLNSIDILKDKIRVVLDLIRVITCLLVGWSYR